MDHNEEIRWSFNFTTAIGIAVLLVIAIGTIGYWVIYPAILAKQTQAIQNSPQFVIGRQEEINKAIEHYYALETQIAALSKTPGNEVLIRGIGGQLNADVCEVRQAVEQLRADLHPERLTKRAKEFLDTTADVLCQ